MGNVEIKSCCKLWCCIYPIGGGEQSVDYRFLRSCYMHFVLPYGQVIFKLWKQLTTKYGMEQFFKVYNWSVNQTVKCRSRKKKIIFAFLELLPSFGFLLIWARLGSTCFIHWIICSYSYVVKRVSVFYLLIRLYLLHIEIWCF